MKSRFKANLYILLFTPLLCFTQHLDSLRTIFNTNANVAVKNQRIDTFIKQHQSKLPTTEIADCYHEIGKWYYLNYKKKNSNIYLDNAITYTQKALSIKKTNKLSIQTIRKTLYNLGTFYFKRQLYSKAIEKYEELINHKIVDKKTLSALHDVSNSYIKIGDFHKALININLLLNHTKTKIEPKLIKKSIQANITKADIYSLMGYTTFSKEIIDCIHHTNSLLNISTNKETKYHSKISQIEGNRLSENGFHKEAIPYFKKVLKGIPINDSINKSIVYNSIGSSFVHLQQKDSALFYLYSSLSYNPYFSPTYENMGDIYIQQSDFKKALDNYQKAINILFVDQNFSVREEIPVTALEEAKAKYDLLHHLTQKAKAWVMYYKKDQNPDYLNQALHTFASADRLIDIIRFETTEYKSKLYWREKGAALYTAAVEVCYLLNRPDKAHYFMEKNKAILLLENLTNTQAKEIAKLPSHLSQREQNLKRAIHLAENNLFLQQKRVLNDSLLFFKQEVYTNKRVYKKFIDSLSNNYPTYALHKKKLPILNYSEMKERYTSANEVVLQYILDKEIGFGLIHTDQKSILFEIKHIKQLFIDINSFNQLVTKPFYSKSEQLQYQKLAYRIFETIIPKDIFEHIKNKKIRIITDHLLQNLSFEALCTTEEAGHYLIYDTEIQYNYSLSYLDQNTKVQRATTDFFLGVAPVQFQDSTLSNLHNSKKEIEAITNITQGDALLEQDASKKTFIAYLPTYQILHLATHADSGTTMDDPWIAFEDQKMTLQEIYASKNQAELVILSGCKTSLGELSKGEGVMSLARGFLYAGANSVISSLWEVNDKANRQLMVDFYNGIDQGLSTSSALRNAKLNYLNTHEGSLQSPMYWGALVLIGDESYLHTSSESNLFLWIGILGGIILLLGLLYGYKKSKS